ALGVARSTVQGARHGIGLEERPSTSLEGDATQTDAQKVLRWHRGKAHRRRFDDEWNAAVRVRLAKAQGLDALPAPGDANGQGIAHHLTTRAGDQTGSIRRQLPLLHGVDDIGFEGAVRGAAVHVVDRYAALYDAVDA